MRINKAFFKLSAILLGLVMAVPALAVNEGAFYEKEHIRGFVGLGGDYRGMNKHYAKYVNDLIYGAGKGYIVTTTNTIPSATEGGDAEEEVVQTYQAARYAGYSKFDDYYVGVHFNIGAEYRQFMTWFDVNFMPFAFCEEGKGAYDACWFNYGVDWMFGWKLLGEHTIINIIPAIGVGFNLLNIHFTDSYDVLGYPGKPGEEYNPENGGQVVKDMSNRYYSTFSPTINAELEVRLDLDPFAIGIYGGYRWIRWDRIDIEDVSYGSEDVNGDTWFLGLRLTWTFLSPWQKRQQDRL